MSGRPPCSEAALFIASTSSRESHETFSATSLMVLGGIWRVVNVDHFAWVKSMMLIDSLNTNKAAESSVNCGLLTKPGAA